MLRIPRASVISFIIVALEMSEEFSVPLLIQLTVETTAIFLCHRCFVILLEPMKHCKFRNKFIQSVLSIVFFRALHLVNLVGALLISLLIVVE